MYDYIYYINYTDVLLTYIFKVNANNSPRSDSIPNKNQYYNIDFHSPIAPVSV